MQQNSSNIFYNYTPLKLKGDTIGGLSALLVALPSTIAFGILAFSPLGVSFSGMAAVGAVLGFVAVNLITPFISSKKIMVTAPNAAAAAVVSLFVKEMMMKDAIQPQTIPIYVALLTLFAGLLQILMGNFGGGKFIKYFPFPVITGYLMGANILIFLGQLPKFLGLPRGTKWIQGITMINQWKWQSIVVGISTLVFMRLSKKYLKHIPAVMTGLTAGVITFFIISFWYPDMLRLEGNNFIIGKLATSPNDLIFIITNKWNLISQINVDTIGDIIVPCLTLTILLSITTLNSCLVLDAKTNTNYNPKNELIAQGISNITSAFMGGIPGAAHLTSSNENINNGGKSILSVFILSIISLILLLFAGNYLAYLPVSALAGILILLSISAIDFKLIALLKNKTTIFDFLVILAVVIAAITLDLVKGAGVGIIMAIFLFLREQMSISVIRRKLLGNQTFSKKLRLHHEQKILAEKGTQTLILEIQGQLFFGTSDQLYSFLEPYYKTCKYFILDFKRIQSVDFTAANMLKKILSKLKDKNGYLILTAIPVILPTGLKVKEYLNTLGLYEHENLKIYDNTEEALEWTEDKIIAAEKLQTIGENKILELNKIELFEKLDINILSKFNECMLEKTFLPSASIFKTGDISDEIYFIRKGTVKIILPLSDGKFYHIVTIGMGGVFGEMAFIDNVRRSADAMAMDDVHLFVLSKSNFERITAQYPEIAAVFFQRLALLTVQRLRQSNKELKVFQEN